MFQLVSSVKQAKLERREILIFSSKSSCFVHKRFFDFCCPQRGLKLTHCLANINIRTHNSNLKMSISNSPTFLSPWKILYVVCTSLLHCPLAEKQVQSRYIRRHAFSIEAFSLFNTCVWLNKRILFKSFIVIQSLVNGFLLKDDVSMRQRKGYRSKAFSGTLI